MQLTLFVAPDSHFAELATELAAKLAAELADEHAGFEAFLESIFERDENEEKRVSLV